jgi:hypothetical protein
MCSGVVDLKQTELCCRKEATTTPAPAEDEKDKEHSLPRY